MKDPCRFCGSIEPINDGSVKFWVHYPDDACAHKECHDKASAAGFYPMRVDQCERRNALAEKAMVILTEGWVRDPSMESVDSLKLAEYVSTVAYQVADAMMKASKIPPR